MFEFSLLSAAKEERPASCCPSAIFGKISKNSPNLAGMILHNSVYHQSSFRPADYDIIVGRIDLSIGRDMVCLNVHYAHSLKVY